MNNPSNISVRPATENVRYRGHNIHLKFQPETGYWQWVLEINRPLVIEGVTPDKAVSLKHAKEKIDTLEDR